MPRHPLLERLRAPLHIAHRGGAGLAPENTMTAFRLAVERWQTDMLEIDVQPTRDGVLVVAHDDEVERCTEGRGRVSELTWDEVSRLDAGHAFSADGGRTFPFRGKGVRISRLAEVLRAFPELPLNVELKPGAPDAVATFAAELREEHAVDRVVCGSEEDAVALAIAETLPEACRFYPRRAALAFGAALRGGQPPPEEPLWHVLDIPWWWEGRPVVSRPLLEAARQLEVWVNVWTVDDPAEMRRLADLGVGGIMTDRPDLLREVLDARS